MMNDATSVAILLFRIVVGAVFLAHGANHLWGGGRLAGTARWFESLGMKPGLLHAAFASVSELVSGALLLIGFLVPLAGAGVVGVMSVAWVINHRKNGFFIFRPGEGYEYVMTLAGCGVMTAGAGGGRYSVDAALGVFDPPGWYGIDIAGLGVASAILLLLRFWRPVRGGAG